MSTPALDLCFVVLFADRTYQTENGSGRGVLSCSISAAKVAQFNDIYKFFSHYFRPEMHFLRK